VYSTYLTGEKSIKVSLLSAKTEDRQWKFFKHSAENSLFNAV